MPVQQSTQEQVVASAVLRWIGIARERYGPEWLPGSIDAAKSSLLRRLLDGKEPLPEPPPRAHSYPWYELVEDGHAQLPAMFVEGPYDRESGTFIHICQYPWTVHATEGAGLWIVSYQDNERWRLRRLGEGDDREKCGMRVVDQGREDILCDWALERIDHA